MRVLMVALLVAVTLSGCTKGDDGTAGAVPHETDDQDPNLGSISGVAVNPTIQPIPGVKVVLKPGDVEKTTDLFGRFSYKDLEPGVYTLRGTLEGYENAAATVTVKAAEIERPKLTMEPILPSVPMHRTLPFLGYIDTWLGPADETADPAKQALEIEECLCEFLFKVPRDTVTVVVEATWDDSVDTVAVPPQYRYQLRNLDSSYSLSGKMADPIVVHASEDDFDSGFDYDDWSVMSITILPDENVPTKDQEFELYITYWVLDAPDPGWSFVGGDT